MKSTSPSTEKLLHQIAQTAINADPPATVGNTDPAIRAANVTSAILSIIFTAIMAYQEHSGEPFDISALPDIPEINPDTLEDIPADIPAKVVKSKKVKKPSA